MKTNTLTIRSRSEIDINYRSERNEKITLHGAYIYIYGDADLKKLEMKPMILMAFYIITGLMVI